MDTKPFKTTHLSKCLLAAISFFCLLQSPIAMAAFTPVVANSAPVLDAATSLSLTVNEDAAFPVGAVGALLSSFTAGITDADGDAKGIAITASNETSGVWYYTQNNGTTWTSLGTVLASNALLLSANANTRLYFRPNANVNGTLSGVLTLNAWDGSSGTVGSRANLLATGGTTAFSVATDVVDISVTPIWNFPIVVNMNPSYDNYTLPSFSNAIPALVYTYAPYTNIKYRFSVKNITTGVTAPDVIQASSFITIPASIHTYASVYTIKASAVINNKVVDYLGNTITINGPTAPKITLTAASCEARLASLASTISADAALNALSYTFRIRYNDSRPNPIYYYAQTPTRFVGANSFGGFPLQYGSSYKVAVQYTYIHPVTGLEAQSGYGAECTIFTPAIPLIGMINPACGSQLASMNTVMAADAGAYATSYQFRIRLADDTSPVPNYYYTMPANNRFLTLTLFQGITMESNTAYYVSVNYSIQERSSTLWSGFGPECRFTTPAAAARLNKTEEFAAIAYPNPFNGSFSLDVKTASGAMLNLKVYDMLGRIIEQQNIQAGDIASTALGEQYPSGVYNVVVSQEDHVKIFKVVKR